MALQLLDGLGRVLASTGEEADLYEIGDDEGSGDDKKKVYAKPKNGDPVTAYVETAQLPSHETVSIPQTFAGLDAVAVPTRLRYQLFTITKVSEQDDYVEVVATHIFYEQINNFTMWEPETLVNYSCGAICRNVLRNQIGNDGGFRVVTDCTDELPWHQIDYARKNIVEAFLNPEDGICTRFNLSMIRDNMDFYVLKNVGYDRGMVIEDGLNLLGIEREENIENVITRVAAYGRDSDGDLVWLNNNGNRYVDSPHINDYARPRVELYDTGIYITGAKEAEELHEQGRDNEIVTADNINAKILAKAQERFTKDEVDVPEVTMNIDFVSLGDTEEYKQYRDLDKVFLYDIVHVKDKRRGYNYSAQVIGVEHDVLTGTLLSVTIGNLTTWDGVRKVANWQVPEIDGSIIRLHSITSSQYAYESITTESIKDKAVTGDKVNVQSVSQALDVNSIKSILAQAGLVLNDQGILIYKNTDDNMLGTRLEVQGRRIGMVIGSNASGDFIKAGEIALAFNNADESVAHINADHVNISATSTLHSLAGAIEEDDQGNVTIVSAGGMRVRKTSGGITSEFGVFDADNLTAGVIVDKVNNGTVTLKGSKVWVGDAATDQTLKKWATESDGLFAQNIGALSARIGTIEADYITASYITADRIRSLVDGGTFSSLGTTSLTVGGVSYAPNAVMKNVTATNNNGTITFTRHWMSGASSEIITFSQATLASITGSWSGATYTASAYDASGTAVGSVSTTIATGSGANGWVLSNDRLFHNVYADGAARLSDDYNLSSYKTTQRAAGAASVTLSAAGWQGGSNVVSASNGKSVTVAFPAVTMGQDSSFSSHKKWVYAYSNEAGISGYVQRLEVDASSEYEAGVTDGSSDYETAFEAGWSAYWNSSLWASVRTSDNLTSVQRPGSTSTSGAVTWFTIMSTASVAFDSTNKKYVATANARSGGGTPFGTSTAESGALSCTVTQTYNTNTHKYTATGTAYEGSSALVSGSKDTGTEAYTAGYNKGWDDAVGMMRTSGAYIYGPSDALRGSSKHWYTVSVTQGQIVATWISGTTYSLVASSSAYIDGTPVDTDQTSRQLTA